MNHPAADYMNRTLVYIQEDDRPEIALRTMLDLGVTTIAVLDTQHRPVGMVGLRDLVDPRKRGARITEPASLLPANATIATAAAVMAQTGYHHIVVTDEAGKALGILSSLDVLRAVSGLEPQHPAKITQLARAGAA